MPTRSRDDCLIAQFKQGKFSAGIVSGVDALDKMARKLELPTRPRSAAEYIVPLVFAGLAIFTAVSLYRRGSSGWAWLFWGGVFVAVWFILRNIAQNSGGSGGGFSGGSFGGGSSGGGGASSSWSGQPFAPQRKLLCFRRTITDTQIHSISKESLNANSN